MQKRNVLNSPRLLELKKGRHRAVLNKILLSLLGLLAVFVLLAYFSHFDSLNINEVQIVGNKIVDAEAIKTAVKQQVAGKYLWFFPKTNILFYPQNSIRNELQDKFKRLKDINFSIQNNKILEVSLSERVAKYTWCGATLPAQAGSPPIDAENQKCYFLDENGYVFDEAPYFSGEVYFKFYGLADLNINNLLGSYFFKQNFKQLISFKDILVSIGLKPAALDITDDGDIEIFLSRGTSSTTGPKIILKADADFQNVAENLEAALSTEPLQSKFKDKYSSLLYIDLRFGNKVYYKFQ
jgi:cell division septal protein FtsQ